MDTSATAIDKQLTMVANLALEIHQDQRRVKESIFRVIDKRTDQKEHRAIYAQWVDSKDVISMALEKYEQYFGADLERYNRSGNVPDS